MASKPLHLTDEERRSLDDLCTSGDIHLSQRARAIVIYSTLQSMKETANKIGVSEQTVSRWVRRFRENGIEGLRVIHPGQSLSQKAETDLITQKVRELSDNSAVSAKQIASDLGVNIRKVYRAFERAGISTNVERHSKWEYKTADRQKGGSPYLAGIYLSYDVKFLILCETPDDLKNKTIHGIITTRDKKLFNELKKSAVTLRMADTLVAAREHIFFSHAGKGEDADRFLTDTIDGWPDGSEYRFLVISMGKVRYLGMKMRGIHYSWAEDLESWAKLIMLPFVSPEQINELNIIAAELQIMKRYIKDLTAEADPYSWRMLYGDYSPLITILNSPDECTGVVDNINDLEQAVHNMFPDDLATPTEGTQVISFVCMKGSDGQLSYQTVKPDALFPDINEQSIGTPEGFDKTINELDRQMTALCHKINFAGRDLFLVNVKKKDTP